MRVSVAGLAVGVMLLAAYPLAQAPAQPTGTTESQAPAPAAQLPPAPSAPKPAAPSAQTPAPTSKPAVTPAPAPPAKFNPEFKYAYIFMQQIAAESVEGKAATEKVKAFQEQKVKELNEKNKALQSATQKLEQGGSVMSEQARTLLQQEIERQQRDIQRFTEDAQQDVTTFTQQLQADFQRKLDPVIDKVAKEKQVHFVFNAPESGLVWADPGMNLTAEVIRAFDVAGAPVRPAPAPAAAPTGK